MRKGQCDNCGKQEPYDPESGEDGPMGWYSVARLMVTVLVGAPSEYLFCSKKCVATYAHFSDVIDEAMS